MEAFFVPCSPPACSRRVWIAQKEGRWNEWADIRPDLSAYLSVKGWRWHEVGRCERDRMGRIEWLSGHVQERENRVKESSKLRPERRPRISRPHDCRET